MSSEHSVYSVGFINQIKGYNQFQVKQACERYYLADAAGFEDGWEELKGDNLVLFNNAQAEIDRYLEQFGINGRNIPSRKAAVIHTSLEDGSKLDWGGVYNVLEQNLCWHDVGIPIISVHRLVHEMIHAKSHHLAIGHKNEPKGDIAKAGLSVASHDTGEHIFELLDEAVVEELTIRIVERMSLNTDFGANLHLLQRGEVKASFNELKRDESDLLGIVFVEQQGDSYRLVPAPKEMMNGQVYSFMFHWNVYQEERKLLHELIQKITIKNMVSRRGPQTEDAVFAQFVKGMFGPSLKGIQHMIDDAFGKKTFQELAKRDRCFDEMDIKYSDFYVQHLTEYIASL